MNRVLLESPYFSTDPRQIMRNITYARLCAAHCLHVLGKSPLPSHLLLTQCHITDDRIEKQRWLGIRAMDEWLRVADGILVYTDLGISDGMHHRIRLARELRIQPDYLSLPNFSVEMLEEATRESLYHFACFVPQNNPRA